MKKKELDAMNVGDEVIDKKNRRFTFTGMNEKSFYMFKGKSRERSSECLQDMPCPN